VTEVIAFREVSVLNFINFVASVLVMLGLEAEMLKETGKDAAEKRSEGVEGN
jgi:hypothetical protein